MHCAEVIAIARIHDSSNVMQGNMVALDTRDILFIVGGAFNGLDQQISDRTATASIGFGSPIRSGRGIALGVNVCCHGLHLTACLRQCCLLLACSLTRL